MFPFIPGLTEPVVGPAESRTRWLAKNDAIGSPGMTIPLELAARLVSTRERGD